MEWYNWEIWRLCTFPHSEWNSSLCLCGLSSNHTETETFPLLTQSKTRTSTQWLSASSTQTSLRLHPCSSRLRWNTNSYVKHRVKWLKRFCQVTVTLTFWPLTTKIKVNMWTLSANHCHRRIRMCVCLVVMPTNKKKKARRTVNNTPF